MAKGRTNQPLTIAVPDAWFTRPEFVALAEQGHTVRGLSMMPTLASVDLILAPQAHFYNEDMTDFLPAAITAARKRKRGTK
jgi:hypothetical protein